MTDQPNAAERAESVGDALAERLIGVVMGSKDADEYAAQLEAEVRTLRAERAEPVSGDVAVAPDGQVLCARCQRLDDRGHPPDCRCECHRPVISAETMKSMLALQREVPPLSREALSFRLNKDVCSPAAYRLVMDHDAAQRSALASEQEQKATLREALREHVEPWLRSLSNLNDIQQIGDIRIEIVDVQQIVLAALDATNEGAET